ncbi:MAG: hypothetical protein HY658_14360 [Actinobacteria bacterium]|nr:hypothetical protein [Actinomycetota bacterium]
MTESSAMRTGRASITDECRRLAELLRLDAVGVVTATEGSRRVAWWAAPDCPPLPARLDDVLEGRSEGWIVCPIEGGSSIFARITAESSIRSPAVLRAVGPSLVASAGGTGGDHPAPIELLDDVREGVPSDTDLREPLDTLREHLGFETASLYLPGVGEGWRLVSRIGPARDWDAVLDPTSLDPGTAGAVYTDARSVPGIGPRLAALGCGSVGILPLPGGGRALLSSAGSATEISWLDGARPYLELVEQMAGDTGDHRRRERADQELGVVQRVAAAARRMLDAPDPAVTELLGAVRAALRAEQVFHAVERGGDLDILVSPGGEWPRRIPKEVRSTLASFSPDHPIEEASARQLGIVLGSRAPFLSAAFCRDDEPMEVLIAAWQDAPGLSPEPMRLVAQVVGAARVAIDNRRRAVDSLMLRERTRWAYEIHDGLTQAVTTAVLELEALRQRIERDPQEAIEVLGATKTEIRKALSELRGLLFDLSQEAPSDPRPEEPLTKYVQDVVRRWRLPARIEVEGDLGPTPKPLLGVAYVVIREALANAAKHSSARSVTVWVSATSEDLTVEVRDSGRGFTASGGQGPRRHFGIEMMKKRVAEVGGSLDIDSSPGKGTRVVARLPVRAEGDGR